MGLNIKGFPGKGTFAHGVHPPERKSFSEDVPIEIIPAPKKVLLPLLQNVGAPCVPQVKARQEVAFGDIIAKGEAFVSMTLHTPIAGKVQRMVMTTLPNGRHVQAVPVKAEGEQLEGKALWDEILGGEWPKDGLDKYDPKEIVNAIQEAGVVGLGGAAFPTHIKFMPNEKKPLDTLLINGCECEPFLTTDYRMMVETPNPIITGTLLAARAAGVKDIVIGIEENKPKAVEVMQKAAAGTGIKIAVLKTKYPQGAEKNLIIAILKREVPLGGLPLDVGVAVSNVGSVAAIARAVIRGKSLTHRVVCVTGGGIANPKNLLVPIGISYGELIEYCGGFTKDAARMISGGPMMGFAFSSQDTVVTKGASALTVLTREDIRKQEETNCVRCGRCVDVCPMFLVPTKQALAGKYKDVELAKKYNIMACYECGSCTFNCPANIPLMQHMRVAKTLVIASERN